MNPTMILVAWVVWFVCTDEMGGATDSVVIDLLARFIR